ncbi:MAG: archaemetzincin [Bacteroidales bacterium]|nr:archaemetzincin [Bacteroidales bacterium]
MRYKYHFPATLLFIITLLFISCFQEEQQTQNDSSGKKTYTLGDFKKLNVFHTPLGKPKPGDWLYYKDEPGQSFKKYINSGPVVPTKTRNKIYILPIGKFYDTETFVINETAKFMHLFFNLEVVIKNIVPSSVIPVSAQRYHFDTNQFHTKYILKEVLYKNLPSDAVVYIAITSNDLYPKDDWNFVFGQANIKKRVGVSSIFRLKYDDLDTSNYHLFLKRIAETTTHETCHMFSILHCTNYKCMMNGSMHLEEADSKPLYLCPECLAKLIWCTNQDVIERYDKLKSFFDKHNFSDEADFCDKSKELLINLK